MGGIHNLSGDLRETLYEVTRMSYGTSQHEKGGTGSIGLLKGDSNECRIVKFDTHRGDNSSKSSEAVDSSNNLRVKLWEIAKEAKLGDDVLADIRRNLQLDKDGNLPKGGIEKPLLARKITAKVVEMIGGRRIWKLAGAGGKGYGTKDVGNTTFENVKANSAQNTANVRTVAVPNEDVEAADRQPIAEQELEMFAKFAEENDNSGDFYIRFAPGPGEKLESAGRRNIFRTSKARAENNEVRQRFQECIRDHFGGKIPDSVKAVMTNFDGGGHPLSAKRVSLILAAVKEEDLKPSGRLEQEAARYVEQLAKGRKPPTINDKKVFLAQMIDWRKFNPSVVMTALNKQISNWAQKNVDSLLNVDLEDFPQEDDKILDLLSENKTKLEYCWAMFLELKEEKPHIPTVEHCLEEIGLYGDSDFNDIESVHYNGFDKNFLKTIFLASLKIALQRKKTELYDQGMKNPSLSRAVKDLRYHDVNEEVVKLWKIIKDKGYFDVDAIKAGVKDEVEKAKRGTRN